MTQRSLDQNNAVKKQKWASKIYAHPESPIIDNMTLDTELIPLTLQESGIQNHGFQSSVEKDTEEKACPPAYSSVAKGNEPPQDNVPSKEGFSFCQSSPRKKATLAQVCFCNFLACASYALFAPFIPAVAAAKGMSLTMIGLLFSCYELCLCLFSPVFGNYMSCIGARFAYVAGQFLAGGCCILFGLQYLSPPGLPFIVLCFTLRCVTAIAESAYCTASFTLVAGEFPDYVATSMGIVETFNGLGMALGPLIGGVLFEIGGFGLPFFITGTSMILCSAISIFLFHSRPGEEKTTQQHQKKGSVLSLLKSPQVLVTCIALACAMYTIGTVDSSLAIHLKQFNVSAVVVGCAFLALTGTFTSLSVVFGWLSDRKQITYPFVIVGSMAIFVALMLLGPSPLLPFLHAKLELAFLCLPLIGAGIGAILTPGLNSLYEGARRLDFKKGHDLDSNVGGLYSAFFHFGTFLGPTIGSPIMEAHGFPWSATLNAALCLIAAVLLSTYFFVERTCLKNNKNQNGVKTETTLLREMQAESGYKTGVTKTQLNILDKRISTELEERVER